MKAESGRESQVRKILDIIPRRGTKAFDFFHQTLVETEQQDLADILKPELSLQHPVSSSVAEKSSSLPGKHF